MSIIPARTAPSVGLRAQLTQLVPPASVPTVDAVRRQLADGTGIVVLTPGCTDKNDKTRLTGRPAVLQAPDGTDKNDENLAARVRHAAALAAVALLVAFGLVAWAPTSIAALAVALAVTLTGGAFLWLASFRLLQHIQRTEGTR